MTTRKVQAKRTSFHGGKKAPTRTLPHVARAPKSIATGDVQPKKAASAPTTPAEDESATRVFHGTFTEMEAFVDRIRAERAAAKPPGVTFRDMVHDAISGLDAALWAHVNHRVALSRGRSADAILEDMAFHDEMRRVHDWLVRLDLEMPSSEVTS